MMPRNEDSEINISDFLQTITEKKSENVKENLEESKCSFEEIPNIQILKSFNFKNPWEKQSINKIGNKSEIKNMKNYENKMKKKKSSFFKIEYFLSNF